MRVDIIGGFVEECPSGGLSYKSQTGGIKIYIYPRHEKQIKEVFQRALDKWPDAPPEMKWLGDIITNGRPMQDYFDNPNLAGKVHPNPADREYAAPAASLNLPDSQQS